MARINFEVYSDAVQGGRNYMEDVINVKLCSTDDESTGGDSYAFFGVFDGHGGAEAARFADQHLRREIDRQESFWSEDDSSVVDAIKGGFIATHRRMTTAVDSWPLTATGLPSTAGTTASVVIIRKNKMYVGHVGDSAVVIGKRSSKQFEGKLVAHCVTVDHKPDSRVERERIEKCGGEVVSKAGVSRVVWKRPRESVVSRKRCIARTDSIPFLAIARSLGDLWSYNKETDSFVVSPEPDVSVHELDGSVHRCVIVASDGVWNMVSPTDAIEFVERWLLQRSRRLALGKDAGYMKQPASGLVKLALDRWQLRGMRADNISAVVVILNPTDDVNSTAVPSPQAKSSDMCRSKRDMLRRVSLHWRRRQRLRTVLGKICRLRAQRNVLSGICVVRSPLATYNRSAAMAGQQHPGTQLISGDDSTSLRSQLRRHSYQEACNDDDDDSDEITVDRQHLRLFVRRLSAGAADCRIAASDNTSPKIPSTGHEPPTGTIDMLSESESNNTADDAGTSVSPEEVFEDEDTHTVAEPMVESIADEAAENDQWDASRCPSNPVCLH